MLNFCTLFNSNYAARGLAMYYSLKKHCKSFHLYVFAFDDELVEFLEYMKLENVTIITLEEFEDPELLIVKPTRTAGEYCWTCTSSTILYCLEHFSLNHCTYIDADLFFFSDPSVLVNEMGVDDVLITEHRYSPQYNSAISNGKYCVQFVTFKNNSNGLKILNWWRNACIEWCYARYEDGKFGDQKYLDDWTTRFSGVHELQHLGGGVAPWNMQQYTFVEQQGKVIGRETLTGKYFPVIFFHFHYLHCTRWSFAIELNLTHYTLSDSARRYIYDTHLKVLKKCFYTVNTWNKDKDGLAFKPAKFHNVWQFIKRVRRKLYIEKDNRISYWIKIK